MDEQTFEKAGNSSWRWIEKQCDWIVRIMSFGSDVLAVSDDRWWGDESS